MATVAAPIDATSTAAWKALEAHQEKLEAEGIDLKAWFAADAERVNKLSFDAGDLHFDLSKNLVTLLPFMVPSSGFLSSVFLSFVFIFIVPLHSVPVLHLL